ncbi:hypothetical protein CIHG_04224 [Coccidioides immitis H538.4]|uniref:GABA permease n=1 Tax=Coccidioides immitis H538.4 TaxID=396776 RepID=A0A0J8RMW7_COCIT|nr:hypothetical protein CIHG_04224 [Coccidioides immitis H538.4]
MVLFNGRGKSCTTPVAGTAKDAEDMRRMNKLQELNRVYTTITLAGYSVILGLTWPFSLFTAALSLTNGGPAGAVWGLCRSVCREPAAGGQYHWVAVFAPAKWRKLASYIVGWYPDVISAVPAPANVGGATIQAFAVVASPAYNPKPWHVVTLTIAICTLAVVFNTFCARKMPGIEGVVFALYILEFFAIFIILLVMGDRSSAREVFTVFQDNAGWGSVGTACFVGASGPVITMIGADSAVHLAEELKDASRHLPRAMMITASVNYLVGFMILLAAMFVVGNVKEVLETPTGAPWVQILLNATQDRKPVLVLMAFIIFFLLFCAINANTTSSRQLYAFARDGGLPYSEWISRPPPFFLGKIGGNVINILALMFLVCFLVAAVFPIEPHPTVQSMNWSSLALGSTLIIALVGWVVRGQKYLGPDVVVPVDDSNIVVAEPKYNKELAA